MQPQHKSQETATVSKADVLQHPGHKPQGAVTAFKAGVLLRVVTAAAADMIGEVVDVNTPLMDAGLTSATAIQMTSALEEALGVDLPGTLIFDYPTVSSLVTYLADCDLALAITDAASSSAPTPTSGASVHGTTDRTTAASDGATLISPMDRVSIVTDGTLSTSVPADASAVIVPPTRAGALPVALASRVAPHGPGPIAIVATAHRVPGGCLKPTASAVAIDRISAVPLDRWDANEAPFDSPSELNAAFGSFLKGADEFDAAAFHLSSSEAVLVDPQQRLLLDCFAEAHSIFSNNSNNISSSSSSPNRQQSGVYVGVSQLEYARITYETGSNLNAYYATGAHLSVASGRIAYTFGLKGPALAGKTLAPS